MLLTPTTSDDEGGRFPPTNPPDARLPKIHVACLYMAAYLLKSRDTTVGTVLAWQSREYCEEVERKPAISAQQVVPKR